MNLDKIKNLVKQNGDKFVFVENGEPEVVMMSWHEYEKIARSDSNIQMRPNYSGDELELFESPGVSQETEFMAPVSAESVGLPVRLEDIRLEDLPI